MPFSTSFTMVCAARPMATPATPALASNGARLKWRTFSMICRKARKTTMPMPVARMTVARVRTWAPRAGPRVSRCSATLMTRPVMKLTTRIEHPGVERDKQSAWAGRCGGIPARRRAIPGSGRGETKVSARTSRRREARGENGGVHWHPMMLLERWVVAAMLGSRTGLDCGRFPANRPPGKPSKSSRRSPPRSCPPGTRHNHHRPFGRRPQRTQSPTRTSRRLPRTRPDAGQPGSADSTAKPDATQPAPPADSAKQPDATQPSPSGGARAPGSRAPGSRPTRSPHGSGTTQASPDASPFVGPGTTANGERYGPVTGAGARS